jgi:branched-chain amino acid transport system ATP-binding protein
VLVVEQNAAVALAAANRAYVLETGRIAVSGTAHELKSDDAVRSAYLGY